MLHSVYRCYTFAGTLLDRKHFNASHSCFLHGWSGTGTARKTGQRKHTYVIYLFTETFHASQNPRKSPCPHSVSLFRRTSGGWGSFRWRGPSRHTRVWGRSCHQSFQTSTETAPRSRNHPFDVLQPVGSQTHCDETRTSQSHDPDRHIQARDTCDIQ